MTSLVAAALLGVLRALGPGWDTAGDAQEIVGAVAQAVVEDGARAPVYGSHVEDGAQLVLWAVRESLLRLGAVNATGRSVGAWQGGGGTALEQARRALWLFHEGARRCPGSPGAIAWGRCHGRDVLTGRDVADLAAERERRARALLSRVVAP